MTLAGIVCVVTCAQCGQTWQRISVIEGQTIECIFCGRPGRLSVGAKPEAAPSGAARGEAWLMD